MDKYVYIFSHNTIHITQKANHYAHSGSQNVKHSFSLYVTDQSKTQTISPAIILGRKLHDKFLLYTKWVSYTQSTASTGILRKVNDHLTQHITRQTWHISSDGNKKATPQRYVQSET